jgi:integrase
MSARRGKAPPGQLAFAADARDTLGAIHPEEASMQDRPRRGWREPVESGLYRQHKRSCASSLDRRPGRRCGCSYEIVVPGARVGSTRIVTVHGTVSDARAERRRLRAAGRPSGTAQASSPGTLDDFAASYFQAKFPVLAPSTVKAREEAYRLRVSPVLGRLDPAELTRERVEVWLAELVESSSRHAVWKSVAALRAILKVAVEWGRLVENPAVGLRLPKAAPEERTAAERVLSQDQLAALLHATKRARVETFLRAAGECGLRAGEVVGLCWPDVDLANRRITVARSVWQEAGRGGRPPRRIVKAPKGNRARRVAISRVFAERLADWYAESVIEGGAPADGYVWPGRGGGPMDASTLGQALARVCARAGLVEEPRLGSREPSPLGRW